MRGEQIALDAQIADVLEHWSIGRLSRVDHNILRLAIFELQRMEDIPARVTIDEAIELANATPYGLAAYIWTGDLARAHRVAHAVEAGMTWVNSHNVRDLRTPFGGVKASGLGREGGPHSLDFYTESRIVHIPLGDTHVPRFGA